MKTRDILICFVIVGAVLLGCIYCISNPQESNPAMAANETAVPTLAQVQAVVGNTSIITPVYKDRFVHDAVAWTIAVEKGDFKEQRTIKTMHDLNALKANIASAQKSVVALRSQGCTDICVSPVSGSVIANIDSALVIGNAATGRYDILGREGYSDEAWDANNIEWAAYDKIGDNVMIQGDSLQIEKENGYMYRLKYTTPIEGVSKKNVDALRNKYKLNVTLTL